MKLLAWLKPKTIPELTNAELNAGILGNFRKMARYNRGVGPAAAAATIILAGLAVAGAVAIGATSWPLIAACALFAGGSGFMGTGFIFNARMRAGQREEDALRTEHEKRAASANSVETVRVVPEVSKLLDTKASAAFNAHVEVDLPLVAGAKVSVTIVPSPALG
jgi:hypothetical protein